jgi:hypothetical protein
MCVSANTTFTTTRALLYDDLVILLDVRLATYS